MLYMGLFFILRFEEFQHKYEEYCKVTLSREI